MISGGDESDAYILASTAAAHLGDAQVRHSDASGQAAVDDPRLQQQLSILRSRQLSQFSVAINGVRLAFWGETAGLVTREIYVEHQTIDVGRRGGKVESLDWNHPSVTTMLLANVGRPLHDVAIVDGRLSIEFVGDDIFAVEPDDHYESWQISSDDGLLIVCTPGGDLTIWYPDR